MFVFFKYKIHHMVIAMRERRASRRVFPTNYQRWSRGHKARGPGKDTKKSKANDSPSEDKRSSGQGQECSRPRPRTQTQVFSKKTVFKIFFQAISRKQKWFSQNFPEVSGVFQRNFNGLKKIGNF